MNVWWLSVSGVTVHKGLCSLSLFIEQHRKHYMEKEWDTLLKSLAEFFLQGIKSLATSDPYKTANIIVYQPVTINGCFQPLW